MTTAWTPGPDLDFAVAQQMGLVPCLGWTEMNFGSFGGPAFMQVTTGPHACFHRSGACYPSNSQGSLGGKVGGVPEFSEVGHPKSLTVEEFPPWWKICRTEDGYDVESPEGVHYKGTTPAHALCVAYVEARMGPKYEDIWDPAWRGDAVDLGITQNPGDNLLPPWSPALVLQVSHYKKNFALLLEHPGKEWEFLDIPTMLRDFESIVAAGVDEAWLKTLGDPKRLKRTESKRPRGWLRR